MDSGQVGDIRNPTWRMTCVDAYYFGMMKLLIDHYNGRSIGACIRTVSIIHISVVYEIIWYLNKANAHYN